MGSISIATPPNAQVRVSISRVAGTKTVTAYSDAAFTSSVTLPTTITSGTTLYLEDDAYLVGLSIGGLDAGSQIVNLYGNQSVGLAAGVDDADLGTLASSGEGMLSVGEETMPRQFAGGNTPTGSTQTLILTPFTARKTEAITQIKTITGSTAAGATPALCRMGFYQVNADGSITLLASHANDTTLFAATYTAYTKTLTSTFNKVAGQRYAHGILVVSGAAIPNFAGGSTVIGSEAGLAPAISLRVTGQTDLPASVAAGSVLSNNSRHYGVALP